MRPRFFLAVILTLSASAFAGDWIEIKSPNFTVRTDAGDARGREVALRFEQMRHIFAVLLPRPMKPAMPLMIVAFRDQQGLRSVGPVWKGKPVDVAGFYVKGDDRNYIAVDATASNAWQTVFHEYAHFLMNTNFPPTPLWWDEGFADYYSTIEVGKKEFTVGAPPAQYPELLAQGLMPLERLFAVASKNMEYNETGHERDLFYAQSWLLVHYLFDTQQLDQTSTYFNLVQNLHEPQSAAVQKAFGKTLKELDDDLKKYLAANGPVTHAYALPTGLASVAYDKRKLADTVVDATIAELHLHSPDHQAEAEQEFRAIVEKLPESSDGHRGLGYILLRKGDFDAASREFAQAADLGSQDAKVYYFTAFSMFKRDGNDPNKLAAMSGYLDQAIAIDPTYAEAYNLKAILVGKASNIAEAVRLLKQAVALEPRREDYKLNLAYQLMRQKRFDEAIALLGALSYSADPAVAASATKQLATARDWQAHPLAQMAAEYQEKRKDSPWAPQAGERLDPEMEQLQAAQSGETERRTDERPMKFAKGTLLSSQCNADGNAVVKARVGKRTLTLHARDYAHLQMVGDKDFNCNSKNRPMAVNYRETSPLVGDIVSLEVK